MVFWGGGGGAEGGGGQVLEKGSGAVALLANSFCYNKKAVPAEE